jgi:GTPase SAR1 family protein
METVKQSVRLPVVRAFAERTREIEDKPHGLLFPSSIRALVCGPSNCGKTTVMYNLLVHANGLKYSKLHIYCPTVHQAKYQALKEIVESIEGMLFRHYGTDEPPPPPNEDMKQSVFVFDDVNTETQTTIKEYFSKGRHYGIDSFLLAQSYNAIPKHLLRDNANFIVLFKQNPLNLETIYRDHVGMDMSYERFKEICESCWKSDKYGFLVIDKDSEPGKGRYRFQFDDFICE